MDVSQGAGTVPREGTNARTTLGWIAIAGVTWFAATIVILHGLRPDVSPLGAVTSEYAVGAYGFLMASAYIAFAIALVSLGIGLRRSLAVRGRGSAGTALLFLAALGTATAALFPIDVGVARPVTTNGWVHRIAAIVAFGSMTVAPLLLARDYREQRGWTGLARYSVVVGVVGLAGLVAIQAVLLERGLAGAAQRVVLALVSAWILLSALRLRSGR